MGPWRGAIAALGLLATAGCGPELRAMDAPGLDASSWQPDERSDAGGVVMGQDAGASGDAALDAGGQGQGDSGERGMDAGRDAGADASAQRDAGPGGPAAGADTDGDGLDDAWEHAAGDVGLLDWQLADSDDDGTDDGDEDPDGDGLTNAQEAACARLTAVGSDPGPHPLRPSLLVELDAMQGKALSDDVLMEAAAVYAEAPYPVANPSGIDVHFYRDQEDLSATDLDGTFAMRNNLLAGSGPSYADSASPAIPYDSMVHVIAATRRSDEPNRGGEAVTGANVAQAGVLIYGDALAALHPQCGASGTEIGLTRALASTLAHELGHALQLGHDTMAGGDVNYWNVMAVPATCVDARKRFHGEGNSDPDLGATEAVGASRLSRAAADLIDLLDVLSVHSATLVNGGQGREM